MKRVTLIPERTEFEFALTNAIKDRKKPILGICGGMQVLNVIFGGTLIQHIPDEISNCLPHEQPNPRCEAGHAIKIIPNTHLYKLAQREIHPVNSAHHQAVKKVAPGFRVNALADDGVIEGIELDLPLEDTGTFIMGVQWHPEFNISPLDCTIFDHFIQAAQLRK